ncbi:3-phosphoshikimate 1-carboxyvinyltransferase [Myroides sp. DW712]|uniref:3-phosphoshikimate 1-carboxyvinyltransferase n=1 Tax=Myroides sp. DW712 TaxID=3389800 RepID=UPI0039793822
MQVHLQQTALKSGQTLELAGSKSESNRLLLLQQLFPELVVDNVADSDDVVAMQTGLASGASQVDVHHAGTAMRFLTAYFAVCQNQTVVLKGSERMHNRPIGVLVDALRSLGAQISYVEKEGYPPLSIRGIWAEGGSIDISAAISSQYISALLLVATRFKKGLTLHLKGEITSRPYIEMTLSLLDELGAKTSFIGQTITVLPPVTLQQTHFTVEADWSSASYYYSLLALSPLGTTLRLGKYKKVSLQGDAALVRIYAKLGVETRFDAGDYIQLVKKEREQPAFDADFRDTPDLAQTVVVSCFGLGIPCTIRGLHTLKIKETDRLVALQNELRKLGGDLQITADSLTLSAKRQVVPAGQAIDTYQDHRMAMAFAPLVTQMDLWINEADVVTKSYPVFWKDLKKLGVQVIESK